MSFASKSYSKRNLAVQAYPAEFQKYLSLALKDTEYENVFHWSNSHAKKFMERMPNCPYTKMEVAQDLRRVRFHSAETTASVPQTTTTVPQTTANECDPTFAEECVGKAKFYSFLYREFDLWYSAFEVEVEEQGGDSAECRWVWQTAQKLSKSTGMSMNYLAPVLNTWLTKRLDA